MKRKVACVNGPNLNLLGVRKKTHYGTTTLKEIENELKKMAQEQKFKIIFFQSNHEGQLIDFIQKERESLDGILINAGALSHYGYALRDALIDTNLPVVGLHLSNIYSRPEEFRHKDILADMTIGGIYGFKEESYQLGLTALINYVKKHHPDRDARQR